MIFTKITNWHLQNGRGYLHEGKLNNNHDILFRAWSTRKRINLHENYVICHENIWRLVSPVCSANDLQWSFLPLDWHFTDFYFGCKLCKNLTDCIHTTILYIRDARYGIFPTIRYAKLILGNHRCWYMNTVFPRYCKTPRFILWKICFFKTVKLLFFSTGFPCFVQWQMISSKITRKNYQEYVFLKKVLWVTIKLLVK